MNFTISMLSMVRLLPCCSRLLGPTTEYKKEKSAASLPFSLHITAGKTAGVVLAGFFGPSGSSVEIEPHSSLLMVAVTLVHLARLTLHKVLNELEDANSDVTEYYLAKAKQLSNDSIRITEGKLNSSRKDQNKINSTSTTDTDKIAATAILLQALNVFGLIDVTAKHVLGQGEQDYNSVEDVLHKCISLYKEPHTRRLVKNAVKQDYMMCLRRLIVMVQRMLPIPQMTGLQELLGEAGQIIGVSRRVLGKNNDT